MSNLPSSGHGEPGQEVNLGEPSAPSQDATVILLRG